MKVKHHIKPSARGGTSHKSNLTRVEKNAHQDYHRLFDVMLPQEIIPFLVETFWKGRWSYVREVMKNQERRR